jgi:AGZA family xanthine/uracil permease-like MFS transporter
VRAAVARAIPRHLRTATAAGIGVFLTFIGLKNAGVIAADPVTFVRLGRLDYPALLMLLGLAVTVLLLKRKSPFAFLAGIFLVTLVALVWGKVQTPPSLFSAPDFRSVFFKLDVLGALKLSLLPAIVAVLFTDLFDSISTFIGVSQAAGMLDEEGHPRRLREGLIVDAWATLGAGLAGTSSGTAYIESVAGINVGGRTGLTAVFTALCFLPCLFVAPLAAMVPAYATSAVLILVGVFMFSSISSVDFSHIEDALPVFLTVILIPLTFSITQGILWGFISHAGLYVIAGRAREVGRVMYALALISVGLLLLERFA